MPSIGCFMPRSAASAASYEHHWRSSLSASCRRGSASKGGLASLAKSNFVWSTSVFLASKISIGVMVAPQFICRRR
jgi:hypothetical protein